MRDALKSSFDTKSLPPRRPRRTDRKTKSLGPLRRLVPFVLRYPWRLAATALFLLISTASSLVIPMIAGQAIDMGFLARNLDEVTRFGWLIVIVAAVMAIASAARFYFISLLGERVLTDLRKSVFDHLLSLDATFFDTHRVGELTSRLNGDVATIRGLIGASISLIMRSTITIGGSLILMVLTSPLLTVAVVVIAPSILFPIIFFSRKLRKLSRRTSDSNALMSAMATEALGATRTVRSFVQEPEQSRLYSERAEHSFNSEVSRLIGRAALIACVMFTTITALVVLIWWGSQAVFSGQVTAGQLTQFMIYALMATGALQSISDVLGSFANVAGSTERLMEILDTQSSLKVRPDPIPLPVPALGTVSFDNVEFRYSTRDDQILRGLSFDVAKGETVALVGSSGAGKSTVFSLIQRFYDVTGGAIRVDGIDIRDLDPSVLRRHFAYVEQEPTIFAGSIAENIRFGRPEASDAEIEEAAKAALVHGFVVELENGYDTIVGERGVMLSGGQKQRIAIARALLKDAPILLLDEATSALDAESERLVQAALERLMEGRTTLVIAHRLATIRDANRILVLEKGHLLDQGSHDELVRKGGRYAELAKLQFRLEQPNAAAE
ncbi:MAG: ATP-binding cassette domain-containing protein [Hyphomicrobiales bacterium]|nr:MAG: ATP-binding cassette domain-containing protein [Hyphomicrobiales bacterium]